MPSLLIPFSMNSSQFLTNSIDPSMWGLKPYLCSWHIFNEYITPLSTSLGYTVDHINIGSSNYILSTINPITGFLNYHGFQLSSIRMHTYVHTELIQAKQIYIHTWFNSTNSHTKLNHNAHDILNKLFLINWILLQTSYLAQVFKSTAFFLTIPIYAALYRYRQVYV